MIEIDKNEPDTSFAGLRRCYEEKNYKTLHAVREAIEHLKTSGSSVTLGRIAEATKQFTATGKSVSHSTILRNTLCRALYEKEAKPTRRKRSAKRTLTGTLQAKPTEVESRRMHYLLRLTKSELVALIIKIERELKSSNSANELLRTKILFDELGPLA